MIWKPIEQAPKNSDYVLLWDPIAGIFVGYWDGMSWRPNYVCNCGKNSSNISPVYYAKFLFKNNMHYMYYNKIKTQVGLAEIYKKYSHIDDRIKDALLKYCNPTHRTDDYAAFYREAKRFLKTMQVQEEEVNEDVISYYERHKE